LIKVYATSVTAGDVRMRKADPFLARTFNGLFKPKKIKVLGFEISGEVIKTGKDVDKFKTGDMVLSLCGISFSGYAQYKCINQNSLMSLKPDCLSHEQAAVVPIGGVGAMALLNMGQIAKGKKVLIVGAAGSIGSYAVQIAKNYGAYVTGVCSGGKMDFVRSLGADEVIDYKGNEYLKQDVEYDLICDAAGKMHTGLGKSKFNNILKKDGSYVSSMMNIDYKMTYMDVLLDLISQGKVKPIIDKVFSIKDIKKAHEHFESGSKKGNIAVIIDF
jgi:NADPH:quinone reductase-like Zn-dependent oxidoreductase